jgi:indolepyruvate ferredoxin oxidoreductase, alpha subunit
MSTLVSGAHALARGAIASGVSLVTSYPGGPATEVVNAVLQLTSADQVRVEWTSNEKVALEMAFGGSMAGVRSLLCVKGVGLNIALDPLMTINLSGCNGGFVLLVGDDPGAWGSQNEQDSRALGLATELPMLEPTSVADAGQAVADAFRLSEEMGLPVIVRVTTALVLAEGQADPAQVVADPQGQPLLGFQREFMRWVVLPINAVSYHRRLHERLDVIQKRFEGSSLNRVQGSGSLGIIASGFASHKLAEWMADRDLTGLRVLSLGTVHPLPTGQIVAFLQSVQTVLVLEETDPLVERAIRAVAQRVGLLLPIQGRDTGHIPRVGELSASHIAAALNNLMPGQELGSGAESSRSLPSRVPLCKGCPYIPTFDALLEVIEEMGGRSHAIVVGDPGCIARAQLPPYELLDVKISLGSSIGIAAGLALSQASPGQVAGRATADPQGRGAANDHPWIVALCGDSSLLHSGLGGLMDAARTGSPMLALILDNGTTALSGGQPHPATPMDARGRPRRAVDLAELARQAGAQAVTVVDLDRGEDIRPAIRAAAGLQGLAVVIARGLCRKYVVRS